MRHPVIALNKVALYFRDRPEVVAVYLFGSYAGGHEKKQSDVDLGVLLEERVVSSKRALETAYTIGLGKLLRKDFHIVVMNDAGEGILAQIFKRGRCIFVQDPETLSRFKMVSYCLIADFSFHRSLMERAFVSRTLRGA
jgi:predicted nucleotidyltransferase